MFANLFGSRRSAGKSDARRSDPNRRPSRTLRMESLEGRVLLDAAPVFDSVVGMGPGFGYNVADAVGNRYVVGTFRGTVDFDPNQTRPDGSDILTARGSEDAFLAKYAPDNSLVWARRMGGDFVWGSGNVNDPMDGGYEIAVDGAGNAYVTGNFVAQADFGPFTLTSAGNADAFVAKIDPSGNFAWANRWGTATREFGNGIAVDASGNVLAAGSTSIVYANGGYTLNGMEMRKYSATGASLWTKQISAYGGNVEGGVATDTAGNMYVTGRFTGTVDFNPDPKKTNYVTGSSTMLANAYILNLTAAGKFGWVSPFIAKSSTARVFLNDITMDPTSNIVVSGSYNGPIDFNPSTSIDFRLPVYSTLDGYVAKLSTTGALAWATPFGGGYVQGIAVDATGVYAAGGYSEVFHPGFGLPDFNGNSIGHLFVGHLTSAGSVDWALTNGGTGSASASDVAVDANGNVSVVGTYNAYNGKVVDFDPDPVGAYELTTPTAASNMFLLKLRKQPALGTLAASTTDAAVAALMATDSLISKSSTKKASPFELGVT